MDITVATSNLHKIEELRALMPEVNLRTSDIPVDVDENADTFIGNALIKAQYLFDRLGTPVLADDSGLCVDCLGGQPGLHSARYGSDVFGRTLTDREKYEYLLHNMEGEKNRSARFVCSIVLITKKDQIYCVQETNEGVIALSPKGDEGFGYDPVFYLPEYGKTEAEIGNEMKNRISHRAKAARKMCQIIKALGLDR